jgi:hypothetical protein
MASTYSNLKIQLMATGENSGTWGTVTNVNLGTAIEEAIAGSADVTFSSGTVTLTLTDTNASQTARNMRLNLTGTSGGAQDLVVPAVEKMYVVNNGCADAITVKVSGQTGVAVPAGKTMILFNNGTDVVDAVTHLSSLTVTGAVTLSNTLSVTGVTTVAAGSNTAPAITTSGDTNTGIFFPAADTIAFTEGGSEVMRITSAGEVLVNTTTAIGDTTGWLTIQKSSGPVLALFRDDISVAATNALGAIGFYGNDTTSNTPTQLAYISAEASGTHSAGDNPTDLVFGVTPDGTATVVEKMRLSSLGGLSVGTTADPGAGAIYATGNITAYYSSDRKFKENIKPIEGALDKVMAIGGKTFDWTDEYIASKGGADGYFVQKSDFGVVAQDVQAVFPQAVRTRNDGSLAVDYEKLSALAFAAIVELKAEVEALKKG